MKFHPNYIKVLENYYKDVSYKDFIKKYPDSEEFVTKGLSIYLMDRRSFYDHEKDKSEPLKIILVNIGSEDSAFEFDFSDGVAFDLMHFKFNNDIVECKPVFRSRLSYNAKIQLFEVFLYEKFKGHEIRNRFFEKGNSIHGNDIQILEERYNNYLADLNSKVTSKKMGDDYESYNNWVAKMKDKIEWSNYWITKHEFHHELLKSFIQGHKYAEFKNTDDKPFKFSNNYFPEFFKELDLFFREDISVGLPYQFYKYQIQLDNDRVGLSRETGFIMDGGQPTGFHHSQMDIELLNPISGEWRDVYIDMMIDNEDKSIDSNVLDFPALKLHLENIKKYGKK
jgi:hypothetical protein